MRRYLSSLFSSTFEWDQWAAKPGEQLNDPPQHKEQDTHLLCRLRKCQGTKNSPGRTRLSPAGLPASTKILELLPTPSWTQLLAQYCSSGREKFLSDSCTSDPLKPQSLRLHVIIPHLYLSLPRQTCYRWQVSNFFCPRNITCPGLPRSRSLCQ